MANVLLVIYRRFSVEDIMLPSGDADPPIAAPWWPKGPVTACIDHEDDDAAPDLVGWIAGFNKKDTSNLFDEVHVQDVIKAWCAQFGHEQWRFDVYNPATRGGYEVKPIPRRKRK